MAARDTAVARIRRLPVVAAALTIGLGVALLQGYVVGVVPLVPTALFLPPAQPLDAVLMVLAGTALLALATGVRRLRQSCAALTLALAAILLLEYVLRIDLRVDSLLFADQTTSLARVFPGRPAPLACVAFLLLGVLLLAASAQPPRPHRWYSAALLGAVVVPVLAISGHLGAVPELYGLLPGSGLAVHAAFALLLLAAGICAATHRLQVVDLLTSDEPGTVLLRRVLPLAILLPILFAVGSVQALRLGFYQVHVGLAAYVSLFIAVSVWAAFRWAAVARRVEAGRRAADQEQARLEFKNRLLEAEAAAQAALKKSEEDTRQLLGLLSHTPVTARGLDGRIRFWSGGAERLYGWTADEVMKAGTRDLLRTELPIPQREVEGELLQHGEWLAEITRQTRSGAALRITTHWILHRDASGRPDAVIEVDDDVTEQRRAEEAVRDSEARYRALVAATARIVWTMSADGRTPGDMSQWEAFTGQTAFEAAHAGWIKVVQPEDQPEAARAWKEAVRGRTVLATQHRLRRKDGEYRHMEVRAVPVLDEQGNLREWVGAHTDVTDRVRAEEQLAQAQKLQAVGTLAGGVAHEVNNQLMAVLGFGEFVTKELGPAHPQAKDVEEMIRAAMRAAQVAQQLLTFSRRQVNQVRPLNVHEAVTALAPVLERLLGADKTLSVLPDRSRSQVMADPTQVDQVLINLAANARDAMGTNAAGRLTIVTDEVDLDDSYGRAHGLKHVVPGPYVRLTVSDTGCGMDRATLGKVFEPFFTTKPVGSGTGLGLSTVYGIVKQHDGFIWAYSEPGLGTTIKIYLPAVAASSAGVAELKVEPPAERKLLEPGLVLVVEDEPAVRQLVRRCLEAVGLTVLEAENGNQALDVVSMRRERPKLVLTDVIMPGLNGRELSERLATAQPGLPVLFMSGYTGDDVLARSLLPETAAFIQKPFAPEELVARVRTMLAQ
ncbi:MAG TPA: PAS domain S-box protein [Gemmatimonadales bacterium]|nr:PAS domain S-box protein [Gemmatimonadales bacterium]